MAKSSSFIPLIFSHLVLFQFAIGQSISPSGCPESFECGNLGIMSFPLARKIEANCGLSIVDCESRPPRIQLPPDGNWYDMVSTVQRNAVRVHASWLDLKSCSSFTNNISLPNTPSITYTISPNITLFRCQTSQGDQSFTPRFSGYQNFTGCEQGGFRLYYNLSDAANHASLDSLPTSCSVIQLPIVLKSDPNYNPMDLNSTFSSVFELGLHVSADCYDCHQRGGQCLTDGNNRVRCSKGSSSRRLIFITVASGGGIAILAIIFFFLRKKYTILNFRKEKYENVEIFLKNCSTLALKRYHYSDIKKMTSSFKTSLGEGGYGSVYKGKLSDGTLVAVKILSDTKGNGEEFINEVASISRTSHVNIVKLLGFCFERNKRALIYEFMANGSLEKFIYAKQSVQDRQLGWQTLYKITIGIARGLEYLHRGCNTQILHFDIKPHNILLDEEFSPKISDFGLSKLCTTTKSHVSILGARGTIGYIAPEVASRTFGGVSHKSDVYSYGMMILEMVGGRKNVDAGVDHSSEIYYPHWVYKQLEQNQELGFCGVLNGEENEIARKMIIVSLWCIQTDPSTRPSISNAVEMLEGNLESLLLPPKPYLYSSNPRNDEDNPMPLYISTFESSSVEINSLQ